MFKRGHFFNKITKFKNALGQKFSRWAFFIFRFRAKLEKGFIIFKLLP